MFCSLRKQSIGLAFSLSIGSVGLEQSLYLRVFQALGFYKGSGVAFGGIGVFVLDDDGLSSGSGSGGTGMASSHGIMPGARALHPALLPADQVLLPSLNLHRPLHPATRHHGPRQVTFLNLLNNPSR